MLAKKAAGPLKRRIVLVLVKDPEPLMFHAEIARRNGKPVGYVRAASHRHTVGGAVGLVMVEAGEPIDTHYLEKAMWEVDIAGKLYPAVASLKPLHDPEAKRVKA